MLMGGALRVGGNEGDMGWSPVNIWLSTESEGLLGWSLWDLAFSG